MLGIIARDIFAVTGHFKGIQLSFDEKLSAKKTKGMYIL